MYSECINKPVVGMVDRLNDPEAELELRERLPFRAMHTSTYPSPPSITEYTPSLNTICATVHTHTHTHTHTMIITDYQLTSSPLPSLSVIVISVVTIDTKIFRWSCSRSREREKNSSVSGILSSMMLIMSISICVSLIGIT